MKKLIFLLVIFTQITLFPQQKLSFDFDYARFRYDSASSYVELYYSFPQSELSLNKTDKGNFVHAILHVELKDSATGQVIRNKDWDIKSPVTDTSGASMNRNLIGVIGLVVPNGVYNCIVSGKDAANPKKEKVINELIKVVPFNRENIALSDIQAASNIKQENADTSSIFFKNTLEVVPNPIVVYGEGLPVIYYYSEIYNLNSGNFTNNLLVKAYLLNSKGNTVFERTKEINRNSESRVEVGTIKINKLPTDTYVLMINVIDSLHNFGVNSTKRVFVYNPSVVDSSAGGYANRDVLSSEFSVMNIEECDNLFEESKYIATDQEIKQYKNIDNVEGKREFLFTFWHKRDKNPLTPENEFEKEYMERVKLSNERFANMGRKGMKTDRGRVYIEYGEPDEIDRYPNEQDKKPYEIWQYHQIEGGVIFIFGDVTGFSNYELLHSTKRGELSDDNWQRRIQTN